MVNIGTPIELGQVVRAQRKALGLRQDEVALAAGVGIRFLSELERGKATARLAETLAVLHSLGLSITIETGEHA